MVNETVIAIAVLAACLGAIGSTIQGYKASESSYSKKKLASALISSVFAAFAIVHVSGIETALGQLGMIGVFVSYAILGYGIDKTYSVLDK